MYQISVFYVAPYMFSRAPEDFRTSSGSIKWMYTESSAIVVKKTLEATLKPQHALFLKNTHFDLLDVKKKKII